MISFAEAAPVSNLEALIRICVAVLIGGVIGIEREYKNRPAGLRTHVLVCMGATMVALLECLLSNQLDGTKASAVGLSMGRISAQVISGIGFLGAGTIFVAQKKISGLTTAASLWNVACLGLFVGFGYYYFALAGCAIVMVVLLLLSKIIKINTIKHVEIRFINRIETLQFIGDFFKQNGISVLDIDFHTENTTENQSVDKISCTYIYTLHLPGHMHYSDLVNKMSEYSDIRMVRTRNV